MESSYLPAEDLWIAQENPISSQSVINIVAKIPPPQGVKVIVNGPVKINHVSPNYIFANIFISE